MGYPPVPRPTLDRTGQAQAALSQRSALSHQQQAEDFLRQQFSLGMIGRRTYAVSKPQTIREELQEEVDGWIK